MKSIFRIFCLLCLCLSLLSIGGYAEDAPYESPLVVFTEPPATPAPTPEPTPDPNLAAPLEVHFLNVKSADCILLKKGSLTMMIDAGNYTESDRILAYLDELGIERLDYAMFTHPHGDHIQGYAAVLEEVEVGVFLEPALYDNYDDEGKDYLEIIHEIMDRRKIPIHILCHKDAMDFAGATIRFYQWENPDARTNNRSMIEHITFGDSAIVLAADIESHAQKALAEELGERLHADILKMPHHGLASYTREFHAAVEPKFATISNTRGNETVEKVIGSLNARGVQWMLTTKGTIVCETDGTQWYINQL